MSVYVCPSTARAATHAIRASNDPNGSPYEQTQSAGYGYMDYAPSVYTDINVVNGVLATGGVGNTTIVPYRNKTLAAKGLLKDGKTAIAEVTDGSSNTIAILECAGRDERFVSQYFEDAYPYAILWFAARGPRASAYRQGHPAGHGTASGGGPTRARRSGPPASPITRDCRPTRAFPGPRTFATAGNQAGPNEEPYSLHPGGSQCSLRRWLGPFRQGQHQPGGVSRF